jgi:hypothetical protein
MPALPATLLWCQADGRGGQAGFWLLSLMFSVAAALSFSLDEFMYWVGSLFSGEITGNP